MFFNMHLREAVWNTFPELPRVGYFTHWLRLMAHRANYGGVEVPLYMVVAVLYYSSRRL